MKAYIIHLERASERRPQVERIRAALQIPTEVVAAVDGAALPEEVFRSRYRKSLLEPHYPFDLRPGEIGCFLSHRKCWALIAASGDEGGFIVEDDVAVDAGLFAAMATFVVSAAHGQAYVRFPFRSGHEPGTVVATDGERSLIAPVTPGLGTVFQYVGRDCAVRLLELTEHFDRPIDGFLQMRFVHNLKIWTAAPVVVRDASAALGASHIQGKSKSLRERVRREFARLLYRLALTRGNSRVQTLR